MDEGEILDIVNNLTSKRSCGHDGFDNFITKKIMSCIIEPFTYICNLSLRTGVFPNKMKLAKIIPIFKKGDPLLISNYRPISLLSTFSKILEKIVFSRTIDFLNTNEILTGCQFGFRKHHNTSHAILSLINKVASSFDKGSHTIGMFLDFSKAFDTIDHKILLYKLSHYGIRGIVLDWFRNYIHERQQYVCIENHTSQLRNINCGVPQGSILGPLLFILYINDFNRSSDLFSFIMYADDTNLFLSHTNIETLCQIVNYELNLVATWVKANKLSLNLDKTNFMLFSNTFKELPYPILIDNIQIQQVATTKFLGTFIDDKLSWKHHIDNICKIISRNVGVINKLKWIFPPNILKSLYSTLVLPHLNYGVLAWGNSATYMLNKLLLLQKKAMRIISHADFRHHTDGLFYSNNTLKIYDIYRLNLAILMYQYNNQRLPSVFNNIFRVNNEIHHYPTRQINLYHLPRTRTALTQNTFIFTAPKFWNSLPLNMRESLCIGTFKLKVKKSLLAPYSQQTSSII